MANTQNRGIGRLSLLGATLIWGSSFIILKSTLDSVPTLWVLALRFTGSALLRALLVSPFPQGVPASAWWSIAYLCFMCTGVCFLLQTIGQKHTPPQTASIILTLESVFGTLLSVLFYHEHLSFKTAAGFVLIFVAVLISETKLSFLKPRSAKRA